MDRVSIRIMKMHSSRNIPTERRFNDFSTSIHICMVTCYGLIDFQYFDRAKTELDWKIAVSVVSV